MVSSFQVFVVKSKQGLRKFIEASGRTYADFDDYLSNNQLPKGPMLYPRNGTYTPDEESKDGRVVLCVGETPSSQFLPRAYKVVSTLVTVGSMAFTAVGIVNYFGPTLLSATVKSVMANGSFFFSCYGMLS